MPVSWRGFIRGIDPLRVLGVQAGNRTPISRATAACSTIELPSQAHRAENFQERDAVVVRRRHGNTLG